MRVLFVDDMATRHVSFLNKYLSKFQHVDHAGTYEEVLEKLVPNEFDMVFLDHDLSFSATLCDPYTTKEKTGSDLARHVVDTFPLKNAPYFVAHSMNPAGNKNIFNILYAAGFSVIALPFDMLIRGDTTIDWS